MGLYEDTFNKLTDKHYKKSDRGQTTWAKWPKPETVREQVADEELFLVFYRELYYRHIYSRCQVNFEDRKGSWENYCKLLDLIIDDLGSGEDLSIALPAQWIW